MAYIRKQRGRWRAEVERNGVRVSAVFDAKAAATAWAAREEAAILDIKRGSLPKKTFGEALDRYAETVSVTKGGAHWEALRITALKRDFPMLVGRVISTLTTADLSAWRDKRLQTVTKGTVQREINLISNVFTKARDEWKWLSESPFKGMSAPGHNPPRDRLPTYSEIKRMLRWLGYRTGQLPGTKQQEVAFAWLLSLRTGMRAGEVLQLCPAVIHGNVAVVRHKEQHITQRPRRVPLSTHALRMLRGFNGFTLTDESREALFRKARDSLLIVGLTFHDARAHALTRLSKKLDVLELARVSGHKDLRVLMDHYYRTTAEDIASRLG